MSERETVTIRMQRVSDGATTPASDEVAVEEPLEIRIGERPISVTMRTPGHDFDLALGFLLTEGIIPDAGAVDSVRHWGSPNIVRIDLEAGVDFDFTRLQRHFYSTSSCGVCGKGSIDLLRIATLPIDSNLTVSATVLQRMPDTLRAAQKGFNATGAIHAAGIFTTDGSLLGAREDVGRHNAVDKVIGALVQSHDLRSCVLVISGRASFEVMQKAIVARIPILAAVGAPSSLAIDLANDFGATLAGFVRDERFNIYTGGHRVR